MRTRPARAARIHCRLGICLVVALTAAGFGAPLTAQEPRVSLQVSPEGDIGVSEIVRADLSIAWGRGQLDLRDPRIEVENLQVVGGPHQSTSTRWINGAASQTRTFTWQLAPISTGTARIHGARVTVAGDVITIPDKSLRIVAEAPPRQQARGRGGSLLDRMARDPFFDRRTGRRERRREAAAPPRIYLRAEATPLRPYAGQQVLYRVYLYYDAMVRDFNPTSIPEFKGFWSHLIPQPSGETEKERVVVDGREIYRALLMEQALFPRRAGVLEIPPIEGVMSVQVNEQSPFGMLSMPRLTQVERASNTLSIEVQALPDPKPAGFAGLVGTAELDTSVDVTDLEVGQAATLTLALSGRGHFQGLAAPKLPAIDDLQLFPPQEDSSQWVRNDRVYGSRTWSYVMVPQRAGVLEVPALEIPYFDPQRSEYRTLNSEPVTLDVAGTTNIVTGGANSIELHDIRTQILPGASLPRRLSPAWLHAAIGLPLLLGLALWAREAFADRAGHAADSGGGAREGSPKTAMATRRRGGMSSRALRRQLHTELDAASHESRPRQAAAIIEEAWRSYLASRWDIAPGAPSTRWGELLTAAGAPANLGHGLVELADDLHYLRYAPKLSSTTDLRDELLARSRTLSKAL